jgi:hypothetical protein
MSAVIRTGVDRHRKVAALSGRNQGGTAESVICETSVPGQSGLLEDGFFIKMMR